MIGEGFSSGLRGGQWLCVFSQAQNGLWNAVAEQLPEMPLLPETPKLSLLQVGEMLYRATLMGTRTNGSKFLHLLNGLLLPCEPSAIKVLLLCLEVDRIIIHIQHIYRKSLGWQRKLLGRVLLLQKSLCHGIVATGGRRDSSAETPEANPKTARRVV